MLDDKLIITLKGGFGNQLFQIVNGISLSKKFNKKLIIDISSFSKLNSYKNTKRNYELGILNLKYKKIYYLAFFYKFYSKFSNKIIHLKEKNFNFNKILLDNDKSYLIDGYWQSYKYFEKDFSFIFNSLENIKKKINLNSFYKDLLRSNSVCVHIRRGDYITNPNTKQFHGICEIDYYEKAISYIYSKIPDANFYFFSDDINFLKKNYANKKNFKIISNSKFNFIEEFVLMLSCSNFILANSSFSWWAAYLSNNVNKLVVAPAKWFNVNIDTSDLIPKEWIRI